MQLVSGYDTQQLTGLLR